MREYISCPRIPAQVVTATAGSGPTAQATYDALGRMVETGSGSTYTQFFYSPLGKQYAVGQNGTLMRGMVPLPGGDTAVYNSAGLNYIRHTDQLGSSRLATTWAHGVLAKDAYAPYGEPYDETTTTDRSFTGQGSDLTQNAGLYDFQFRKLDTTSGRWLSPDPSGWSAVDLTDPQSLNRYAYAENSPLTSVDPLGLRSRLVWQCTTTTSYDFSREIKTISTDCIPFLIIEPDARQQLATTTSGSSGGTPAPKAPNNGPQETPTQQQCHDAAAAASAPAFAAAKKALPSGYKIGGSLIGGAVVATALGAAKGSRVGPYGAVLAGLAAAASPFYESAAAFVTGEVISASTYTGCATSGNPGLVGPGGISF